MANQGQSSQQGKTSEQSQSKGAGRGFAAMDPEERREVAAEGGRASHQSQDSQGGMDSQGGQAEGNRSQSNENQKKSSSQNRQ